MKTFHGLNVSELPRMFGTRRENPRKRQNRETKGLRGRNETHLVLWQECQMWDHECRNTDEVDGRIEPFQQDNVVEKGLLAWSDWFFDADHRICRRKRGSLLPFRSP
jgi:hypothetical protein